MNVLSKGLYWGPHLASVLAGLLLLFGSTVSFGAGPHLSIFDEEANLRANPSMFEESLGPTNPQFDSDAALDGVVRSRLLKERKVAEVERQLYIERQRAKNKDMRSICGCMFSDIAEGEWGKACSSDVQFGLTRIPKKPNGLYFLTEEEKEAISRGKKRKRAEHRRRKQAIRSQCEKWKTAYDRALRQGKDVDDSAYVSRIHSLNSDISREIEAERKEEERRASALQQQYQKQRIKEQTRISIQRQAEHNVQRDKEEEAKKVIHELSLKRDQEKRMACEKKIASQPTGSMPSCSCMEFHPAKHRWKACAK